MSLKLNIFKPLKVCNKLKTWKSNYFNRHWSNEKSKSAFKLIDLMKKHYIHCFKSIPRVVVMCFSEIFFQILLKITWENDISLRISKLITSRLTSFEFDLIFILFYTTFKSIIFIFDKSKKVWIKKFLIIFYVFLP